MHVSLPPSGVAATVDLAKGRITDRISVRGMPTRIVRLGVID